LPSRGGERYEGAGAQHVRGARLRTEPYGTISETPSSGHRPTKQVDRCSDRSGKTPGARTGETVLAPGVSIMHIAGLAPTPATFPTGWGLLRLPRTARRRTENPIPFPRLHLKPRRILARAIGTSATPDHARNNLRNLNADLHLRHLFLYTISRGRDRSGHEKTSGGCW
jgi:hypothetical protein